MTAEAAAPDPLTLDEFVALMRERILTERIPPSVAFDRLNGRIILDDEAEMTLLRTGAIQLVGAIMHDVRSAPHRNREWLRFQTKSPHGRRAWSKHLHELETLRAPFESADGSIKPLLEFSLEDWRYLVDACSHKSASWLDRANAAQQVADIVKDRGVGTTKELPFATLREIEGIISGAWSE